MKNTVLLSLLLSCLSVTAQVSVQNLRLENLVNPIGLDVLQLRFAWQLTAERRNVLQTAYEIRVASNSNDLVSGKKLLWTSGKTQSDASVWVPYNGPALISGKKYWWQVRVWDLSLIHI